MSTDPKQFTPLITVTEKAHQHFLDTLKGQEHMMIRVTAETSGCNGYSFSLRLVPVPEATDTMYRIDKAIVFSVAPAAMKLITGTEIDVVTEGLSRVVKFNNPNATAECGCGKSFSM